MSSREKPHHLEEPKSPVSLAERRRLDDVPTKLLDLRFVTSCILVSIAAGSGFYTYQGVSPMLAAGGGESLFTKGGALLFAVIISMGIFLLWRTSLDYLPRMRSRQDRTPLVRTVLFLVIPLIVLVSAFFNAIGIFGFAATEHNLQVVVTDYENAIDAGIRRALKVDQLRPIIVVEAVRLEDRAECERERGCLTGIPGEGAASISLDQAAARLRGLEAVVERSSADVLSLVESGREQLGVLRGTLRASEPLAVRRQRFADQALVLDAILARLAEETPLPAIASVAETLGEGQVAAATSKRSASLAQNQTKVMASVARSLEITGALLADNAQELADLPPVQAPRYQALSAAKAVLVHASDFLPAWAAALAIDFIPLPILIFQMVAHRAMRRLDEEEGDDPSRSENVIPMRKEA